MSGVAPPCAAFEAEGFHRWSTLRLRRAERDSWVTQYGFSIPCEEAVKALVALAPIVEVGAGTGYWTCLLRHGGHDIIATDNRRTDYGFKQRWCAVKRQSARAAIAANPDRDVLCSWPCYDNPWLAKAIRGMGPGRALALIGEGSGGCTGDDTLFAILGGDDWKEEVEITIPQFPGLNDFLSIYRRVR